MYCLALRRNSAIDSSESRAISQLSWFRRETFRPPGHRVKDADVVFDILNTLHGRMELVKLIKVNGHMGDPLHSAADEAVPSLKPVS
jgi:ribonuclease HI